MNTRRPTVLFVSWLQFGYHTDTLEYCRYLKRRFRLLYLCADQGLPRKCVDGVEVLYSRRRVFGKVELGLAAESIEVIRSENPDLAFLQRSKFSFLVRLSRPSIPMVLDIRSGSVDHGVFNRAIQNTIVGLNARFFKHITVISPGLATRLRLPRRAHILPLGADRPTDQTKLVRNELRLIYVGTFNHRELHRTIAGLGLFVRRYEGTLPISYTLAGFGGDGVKKRIQDAVVTENLEDRVRVHGRIDHDELPVLLQAHNVGVAFTPQVPWFEFQPSTKVFEYLQSGLLCLATNNTANREVVSDCNGVLIDDSPAAFAVGLQRVVEMLPTWKPELITDSVRDHTWNRIVEENLVPYLESAMGPQDDCG